MTEAEVDLSLIPKPRVETLGDGKQYTFEPASMGHVAELRAECREMGIDMTKKEALLEMSIEVALVAIWIRLRGNHPELTSFVKAGKLITSMEMMELAVGIANEVTELLGGDE